MVKLLVDSYRTLVEIALWLFLVIAAIFGYMVGLKTGSGPLGGLVGVGAAFVFSALFVAPFLIIVEMRDHLKKIEEIKIAEQRRFAVGSQAHDRTNRAPSRPLSEATGNAEAKVAAGSGTIAAPDSNPKSAVPQSSKVKLTEGQEILVETRNGIPIYRRYNGHFIADRWFANHREASNFVDENIEKAQELIGNN